VGIALALRESGHNVDVIFTCQTELLIKLVSNRSYDIVLINDIVHGFSSLDKSARLIPISPLRVLREQRVKIVGILIESIFIDDTSLYDETVYHLRKHAVEQAAVWLDFVISYDRHDVDVLRDLGVNILWTPFFSEVPNLATYPLPNSDLVFYGGMYPKRQRFLKDSGTENLISGGYIDYPAAYSEMFQRLIYTIQLTETSHETSLELVSMFKKYVFHYYAQKLQNQRIIINLPSIFRGIPCRVVESIAMGRPFLCPKPRHPKEIALLKMLPDRTCMMYDENRPERFRDLLKEASSTDFQESGRIVLSRPYCQSPFSPKTFAVNFTKFISGEMTPTEIEASYLYKGEPSVNAYPGHSHY
jgi:hypothetical protein